MRQLKRNSQLGSSIKFYKIVLKKSKLVNKFLIQLRVFALIFSTMRTGRNTRIPYFPNSNFCFHLPWTQDIQHSFLSFLFFSFFPFRASLCNTVEMPLWWWEVKLMFLIPCKKVPTKLELSTENLSPPNNKKGPRVRSYLSVSTEKGPAQTCPSLNSKGQLKTSSEAFLDKRKYSK